MMRRHEIHQPPSAGTLPAAMDPFTAPFAGVSADSSAPLATQRCGESVTAPLHFAALSGQAGSVEVIMVAQTRTENIAQAGRQVERKESSRQASSLPVYISHRPPYSSIAPASSASTAASRLATETEAAALVGTTAVAGGVSAAGAGAGASVGSEAGAGAAGSGEGATASASGWGSGAAAGAGAPGVAAGAGAGLPSPL